MKKDIFVKGAKEHNLKNIDVRIPRDQFVVITGLSGSGKSSLAFDTIYAEGQRRYVESLSAYARQFLGQMEKPKVEFIEGLSPAISIDQKTTSKNPRSTVGTVTEIYDYLRLLYARVGTPHCPVCDKVIEPLTIDDVVDRILELEEGKKILLLSPVIRGKKGTHKKVFEALKQDGFSRVKVNGSMYELLEEEVELDKNKKHNIDVVVDRLVIRPDIKSRLADSLEVAMGLEDTQVKIEILGEGEQTYNLKFACPEHGLGISEMEPRSFSFNSPFGACSDCKGLGMLLEIDRDLIIPDDSLSIAKGAIVPFRNASKSYHYGGMLRELLRGTGYSFDTPIKEFDEKALNRVLYGETGKKEEVIYVEGRFGKRAINTKNEGVISNLERRYKETNSSFMRSEIEKYMSEKQCPTCRGRRLSDEVLSVKVFGKNIIELTNLSVGEIYAFFEEHKFVGRNEKISEQIIKEIQARLSFLIDVGLDYLTLSRKAATLSGGESQRIRLATQIGSGLVGVLYILDEPSIGLHQKDNRRLLDTLKNLTSLGNTLLVVEHDEETIREADYVLDIGPYAGENGGQLVASGSLENILQSKRSITAKYLTGELKIEVPKQRRQFHDVIKVRGATQNNLKSVNVDVPLGVFTCVTGVSGSGKSSLINEVFYKSLHEKIYSRSTKKNTNYKSISGYEKIKKIIDIDQSPIGRTPRSNPATYTKVFDPIRDLFAELNESKIRGYKKGRFSFNVKGGRCEACNGDGINKIEMHFLPDIYVKCDTCGGKRYNRETLEVKYKGKNIYDVLDLTVDDALIFFQNIPTIKRKLQTLQDVGLGYIRLGQPSTQLSGGEAQRIKLASELSKNSKGDTLYILDEPTTGLHMYDVHMLIDVLNRLVENGNTLVVIEHNLDVIKSADYIIDLGPDGGHRGGKVIAKGTPEEVSTVEGSYTGEYLKDIL